MTIREIIQQQILAEGPQHEDGWSASLYVEDTVNALTNSELLRRISDALASQSYRETAK